jgi:hypothetical protein
MLKRLPILVLAILFAVGVTAQLVPHAASAMAMEAAAPSVPCPMDDDAPPCPMTAADDGSPNGATPDMPCRGMMPGCLGNLGCFVGIDLPPRMTTASPVEWATVTWSVGDSYLAGLEVEPELFPPIRNV